MGPDELEPAIAAAERYVLGRQLPSGAWPGQSIAGADPTAEALIAYSYAGALDPHEAGKARRWLVAQQQPDGSYEAYQGQGRGTLDDTAIVYAALLAAGEDPRSPAADKAWRYIHRNGGFRRCYLYTQILVSAAGLMEPRDLPSLPLGWVLVPGVERLIGRSFTPAFTLMMHMLPAVIRGLQARRRPAHPWRQPLAAAQERQILAYLQAHQNPTGNFFGAINLTVMGILCMCSLGLDATDTRVMRAIDDLAQWRVEEGDTVYYYSFDSQIWNTALIVSEMCEGERTADEGALAKAIQYLVSRQSFWELPADWQNPTWCTPATGGWPFQDRNPLSADCDSTGVVLHALGQTCARSGRTDRAIAAGVEWLFGMQNRDGGWAAFSRGQRGKPPGPFPLTPLEVPSGVAGMLRMAWKPPVRLGDPSTADLTGRVLQGLGKLGYRAHHPRVARAIEFLRAQRCDNGVWWGRWETNYLAGTAEVLAGLAAVGEDLSRPEYQEAIAWVIEHQNGDGGWGETVDSYENLGLAGIGDSSSYLTGIVTKALIGCGHGHSRAVQAALRCLLATQEDEGSWAQGPYQFVVQWPWPFYRLVLTPTIYPLSALIAYRSVVRGRAAAAPGLQDVFVAA